MNQAQIAYPPLDKRSQEIEIPPENVSTLDPAEPGHAALLVRGLHACHIADQHKVVLVRLFRALQRVEKPVNCGGWVVADEGEATRPTREAEKLGRYPALTQAGKVNVEP